VCGRGGDIFDLEADLIGGDFPTRKAEVFRLVGRFESLNGFSKVPILEKSPDAAHSKTDGSTGRWRETARYRYEDRDGSLLFEVIRYMKSDETKSFMQVRPSGTEAAGTTDPQRPCGVEADGTVVGLKAGKYLRDPKAERINGKPTWKFADDQEKDYGAAEYHFRECPRVPYRFPKVLNARTVFLPEGEKDVHTLESWGLVASCNPGGSDSSHLYAGWTEHFRGKHLIILPDNDEPGRKHAAAKAALLLSVSASVQVVELPGLAPKGDITDWRDAGGTLERFNELTAATPALDAAALAELRARWGLTNEESRKDQSRWAKVPDSGTVITRRLSDIESRPVSWLWQGRIPRGKLTIIAGNPGLGKSQITASIAAVVTSGGQWPVDRTRCASGNVLFLTAEDDAADTLRPRLEAAGANLTRVHIIEGVTAGYTGDGARRDRVFSLEQDLSLAEKLSEIGGVSALIIDPISAYLGSTDSHVNAEVRGLLTPLSELAAKHDVALIGVSHLNKAGAAEAMMRVSGSLAFIAAARAAYLVARDPDDKTRRLLLPLKNNLAPDAAGLAYRIESVSVESKAGTLQTSRVLWDAESVTVTADEVMQSSTPQKTSALAEAKEWLEHSLGGGPMPATEVFELADAVGISRKTLRRAREELGIGTQKMSMKGGWNWNLPPKVPKSIEEAQKNNLGILGDLGHLPEPEAIDEVEL
jgi:hypothetical protein